MEANWNQQHITFIMMDITHTHSTSNTIKLWARDKGIEVKNSRQRKFNITQVIP